MKKKSVIILISSVILVGGIIAGILLINPKSETPQTETDNTISESTEDLGTTTNADRGSSTGEVVDNSNTNTQENPGATALVDYSAFSSANIILLVNGTFYYKDEFLSAVMELPQYSKFSSNEVKKALNVFAYSLTAYDINDTQGVYNYINQWTEQDIQYLIDSGDTYLPSVTPEDLENAQTQAPEIDQSDITSLNTPMYSTGDVNVRKGPSTDYEKIGALALNQEVKVTGQSKSTGWYRIEFNGGDGYVSNSLLANEKVSLYISERYGWKIGDSTTMDNGVVVTYQGNDVWIDGQANKYIVTKDLGNGSFWLEAQNPQPEYTEPQPEYTEPQPSIPTTPETGGGSKWITT